MLIRMLRRPTYSAALEVCLDALDILRALNTKVQNKLPILEGPYALPVAAVEDLKTFLKSSLLAEEEQPPVQVPPAAPPPPPPPPEVRGGLAYESRMFKEGLSKPSVNGPPRVAESRQPGWYGKRRRRAPNLGNQPRCKRRYQAKEGLIFVHVHRRAWLLLALGAASGPIAQVELQTALFWFFWLVADQSTATDADHDFGSLGKQIGQDLELLWEHGLIRKRGSTYEFREKGRIMLAATDHLAVTEWWKDCPSTYAN